MTKLEDFQLHTGRRRFIQGLPILLVSAGEYERLTKREPPVVFAPGEVTRKRVFADGGDHRRVDR